MTIDTADARVTPTGLRPGLVVAITDVEWTVRSLELLLNPQGYVVMSAATIHDVVGVASTLNPDALVIEHSLPNRDAVAALSAVRSDGRLYPATPLVVLSSSPIDRAQRHALYDAGAWMLCAQPIDGDSFVRQLQTFVRVRRYVERLRDSSLVDPVTGIYTPRGLEQRAREVGAGASRRHEALTCIAVAIEVRGPAKAPPTPSFLVAAARRLRLEWSQSARTTDVLGHLGTGEFGIVAGGASREGAEVLVTRLRDRLEPLPVTVDGVRYELRLRVECADVLDYAESPADALELLHKASRALRNADAVERETS